MNTMNKEFLIIGITGPLGSGCSEIAHFISNGLKLYQSNFKQNHLRKIDAYIDKYYRYLKEINLSHTECGNKLDDIKEDLFVDPDEYHRSMNQTKENLDRYDLTSKQINRKLRQLLFSKKVMESFCSTDWNKFVNISMSTVIMKIIAEKSIDDKGNISPTLQNPTLKILEGAKQKICKLGRENINLMRDFREIVSEKTYTKLEPEFCSKIDQYLIDLKNIKRDIINAGEVDDCWLQDMGDNIRLTGNPFNNTPENNFTNLDKIAEEANFLIKFYRRRNDNKKSNYFVIDSFRNPAEVQFFDQRYSSFYLCSVFASKASRIERLNKKFNEEREKRDQGEGYSTSNLHKQNVPECVLLADYALNNEIKDKYKHKIARLLVLINYPGTVYPTADEVAMNLAYSLSLRSTCLSRQVGAVITNEDGFVLTAGWNDVGSGQLGCSLNCKNDYTRYSGENHLLSVWGKEIDAFKKKGMLDSISDSDYFCYKDIKSKQILSDKIEDAIKEIIYSNEQSKDDKNEENEILKKVSDHLKSKLSVKRLEYARALHAEENALLQAARFGGIGVAGGTIYSTTFPCELCAKKIYQSHIKRIVYTEPYPDSISENIFLKDGVRHIQIDQFEGVKSPSFYKLFKPPHNIKERQKMNVGGIS